MQQEVAPTVAAPRRRFQYSLSTLMLLTTIVACLAALWATYRELKQARADRQAAIEEVKKYREEMGYLEIDDPKKIHARGVRLIPNAAVAHRWSWRVYLPGARQFQVYASTSRIPIDGFPAERWPPIRTAPGENLIDASAEQGRDGKWYLSVHVRDVRGASRPMAPWKSGCSRGVSEDGQQTWEPDKPLILLRYQNDVEISPGHFESVEPPGTSDGIMIWIEEEKPVKK